MVNKLLKRLPLRSQKAEWSPWVTAGISSSHTVKCIHGYTILLFLVHFKTRNESLEEWHFQQKPKKNSHLKERENLTVRSSRATETFRSATQLGWSAVHSCSLTSRRTPDFLGDCNLEIFEVFPQQSIALLTFNIFTCRVSLQILYRITHVLIVQHLHAQTGVTKDIVRYKMVINVTNIYVGTGTVSSTFIYFTIERKDRHTSYYYKRTVIYIDCKIIQCRNEQVNSRGPLQIFPTWGLRLYKTPGGRKASLRWCFEAERDGVRGQQAPNNFILLL